MPAWKLLVVFSWISARSWGGGSGTIYAMHQELVRRHWLTSAQFTLDFGLARIVPGINLLATAVMTGYRLRGVPGSIAAITGLMWPASLITVVITIGFAQIMSNSIGTAMVQGAVPVTAALTFALARDMAKGSVPWKDRRIAILMALYAVVCFFLVAALQVSSAVGIIAGALLGIVVFRPSEQRDASRVPPTPTKGEGGAP
ncbi:MAG: Chromate transporter [Chloroflexi bacterium]|nr:Chromate transporter [Chloroflexota bacterium]